jgi:hypothetical protein
VFPYPKRHVSDFVLRRLQGRVGFPGQDREVGLGEWEVRDKEERDVGRKGARKRGKRGEKSGVLRRWSCPGRRNQDYI